MFEAVIGCGSEVGGQMENTNLEVREIDGIIPLKEMSGSEVLRM